MFKSAFISAPDWRGAAEGLADTLGEPNGANFGLIYTTEPMGGELDNIVSHLKGATGVENWAGSVGLGICAASPGQPGEEYFDEPAVAVMTAELPADSFSLFTSSDQCAPRNQDDDPYGMAGLPFVLAHADSANPDILGLVDKMANVTDGFVVGGLTASRTAKHHIAGTLTGGGISGVIFGPEVGVMTSLSQGCMPIGDTHTVTEAMDNFIIELDDRPALEVLKEDLGEELAANLRNLGGYIHAAFPISGSDTGDFVVRNLIGVDEERGIVAIGMPTEAGYKVMFVCRDEDAAKADLTQTVEALIKRAGGQAKAALYISCIARGPHMFGAQNAETALLQDIIGDIPLIGMYANGEISNSRLYSYTGILTLFL